MAEERWVPCNGYELTKVDGSYRILKRGDKWVSNRIPDDEVQYRPIAIVEDYDEAHDILRALRAALLPSEKAPDA